MNYSYRIVDSFCGYYFISTSTTNSSVFDIFCYKIINIAIIAQPTSVCHFAVVLKKQNGLL